MVSRPKSILSARLKAVGLAGVLSVGTSLGGHSVEKISATKCEDEGKETGGETGTLQLAGLASLSSLTELVKSESAPASHPDLAPRESATGRSGERFLVADNVLPGFRSTGLPELRPVDSGGPLPPLQPTDGAIPPPQSATFRGSGGGVSPAPFTPRPAAPHSRTSEAAAAQRVDFHNRFPDLRTFLAGYGVSTGMRAGVTYDDNVSLGNGRDRVKDSSVVYTLSPYIRITRGGPSGYEGGSRDSLSLQYSPSFVFYQNDSNLNDAPQSLDLTASILFSKLQLTLSQQILFFSDATFVSNSVRDDRKFYSTYIGAYYALAPKIQVESNFALGVRDFENGFNNYSISAGAAVFFAILPKVSIGPGVSAGWDFVQDQPSQPFQQVNFGLRYDTFHKLSFNLSIGAEFRELSRNTQVGLVYSGGADYRITDQSSLHLSIYRRNSNSSVIIDRTSANNPVNGTFDENYTATGVSLSFNQTVLQRLSVNASLAYENSAYYSSISGGDSGRNFDYLSAGLTLSLPVADWASLNASYYYRQNSGNNDVQGLGGGSFNFRDNQVSFYVSLQL